MSFQQDDTWDGYSVKKVFSDDGGAFFPGGPRYASYYHEMFLGYFKSEKEAEGAFFKEKGVSDPRKRRGY